MSVSQYLPLNSICCCCCSVVNSCLTLCDPWTKAHQASLSLTISQSLLKLMSIESVMPPNHLILCHPLQHQCLSHHQCLCKWVSSSLQVAKVFIGASASASVLPMNIQGWFPLELTGLISLLSKGLSRIFSSTSSKASILWCSVFFMVQLSNPYMTIRTTIALTRWTFVSKVMYVSAS